jgi:hypothetical protein
MSVLNFQTSDRVGFLLEWCKMIPDRVLTMELWVKVRLLWTQQESPITKILTSLTWLMWESRQETQSRANLTRWIKWPFQHLTLDSQKFIRLLRTISLTLGLKFQVEQITILEVTEMLTVCIWEVAKAPWVASSLAAEPVGQKGSQLRVHNALQRWCHVLSLPTKSEPWDSQTLIPSFLRSTWAK